MLRIFRNWPALQLQTRLNFGEFSLPMKNGVYYIPIAWLSQTIGKKETGLAAL
jgi:hypothetical protein